METFIAVLIAIALLVRYISNEIEMLSIKQKLIHKNDLIKLQEERISIEEKSRAEDAKHIKLCVSSYLTIIQSAEIHPQMKEFAEDLASKSIGYLKIGKRIELAELEKQLHDFHYK